MLEYKNNIQKEMFQSRTHTCNEINMKDCGTQVVLVGWYANLRKISKNLGFLLLRDFYGITQIVIENDEMMKCIDEMNFESTLLVEGIVRERSNKNKSMVTGDVEVLPTKIEVLSRCIYNALPFEINHSQDADENLRLKYRFLDLRNFEVRNRVLLRTMVVRELRNSMNELGFVEVTTPILTCSSPEGARDYLVPSRNHPGKFYALPQAPQQFKQILMASGFDRYFQIAPCFRDEDARADRSPGEFYQLDMEMAFANQEDVFYVIENVLPNLFKKYGIYNNISDTPFDRIPYKKALEDYGTDKPDLRIDLLIQDVTDILCDCGFEVFKTQTIKAIVTDSYHATRKEIDKLCSDIENETGHKVYWFKVSEDSNYVGGISKYVLTRKDKLDSRLKLKAGDFVTIVSGKKKEAQKTAGILRNIIGKASAGHFNENQYKFCWIVDFPMYEIGEESNNLEFCHNPFSMPQGGICALKNIEPLDILAYQYDLVCNGIELSSGAVRNHDPETMVEAFRIVGLGEEEVKSKFPAMYNAFCYGAPPHAGIAPGIERMVMLLAGGENIREVIPFPMNKRAQDVMMGAPSEVNQKQLDDVHIKINL